jgi:hypothetical protein
MTKLKEEFFKILPPTIFFFVALHLVMFIRVLMLEGTGLSPYSSASIAITALVLGKAVLIADMLPIINRFPNKPLIYNIAWKTVIYLLLSAVIHYLERLFECKYLGAPCKRFVSDTQATARRSLGAGKSSSATSTMTSPLRNRRPRIPAVEPRPLSFIA